MDLMPGGKEVHRERPNLEEAGFKVLAPQLQAFSGPIPSGLKLWSSGWAVVPIRKTRLTILKDAESAAPDCAV